MVIYPSITSITPGGWREKIGEIKKLGLREFCLFPTTLNKRERQWLYKELKKIDIRQIPLVHLRDDMLIDEVEYLVKNFRAKIFNLHAVGPHSNINNYGRYRKVIYVENLIGNLPEASVKKYAGLCLDVAHLEAARLSGRKAECTTLIKLAERYKIGVAHISGIVKKKIRIKEARDYDYAVHYYRKLDNFDYLLKYKKYLPDTVALELENSIKEQLKAKEYIEKILK